MPYKLRDHPYFEPWTDPKSGVTSFILTERVAPVQQTFYFTNPSVSPNEEWLWFYTAFPPGAPRTLGAVSLDPDHPDIRHFPGDAFSAASPMVAPEGEGVYFCMGSSVWYQPLDGEPEVVCTLDESWINSRRFKRMATHLTLSKDGRYFLLDGDIGDHWWVGIGDRMTGHVEVLKEFARHYNHAQFSTVDTDKFLIAQDWWNDPVTGQYFPYDHRIWLMDIEQTAFEPLRPQDWYRHGSAASHEWWSDDGFICWVDYELGAFECHPDDRVAHKVWKGPLCHAHCDPTRRYWCADESPYKWDEKPCQILFYDRKTDRQIQITSGLPKPPLPRSQYHLDPHPQFSPRGSWITYTTTVRDMVDVAVTPVTGVLGEAKNQEE